MSNDDLRNTLERLASLPATANFTPREAALYLNTRQDLFRTWRWQGCGPRFLGRGHFIRYPNSELDAFLAGGRQSGKAA